MLSCPSACPHCALTNTHTPQPTPSALCMCPCASPHPFMLMPIHASTCPSTSHHLCCPSVPPSMLLSLSPHHVHAHATHLLCLPPSMPPVCATCPCRPSVLPVHATRLC